MKNHIFFILLFCANSCFGEAIDSVKTKQDLYQFCSKHLDWSLDKSFFSPVPVGQLSSTSTHFGSDSFYVVDIDKNGLKDLVIDGQSFDIFLAEGGNKFKLLSLGSLAVHYTYVGTREKDSTNQLLVKIKRRDRIGRSTTYDTALIYRDGSFIEYVAKPSTHSIDQINYRFGGGWSAEAYTVSIDRTHPDYPRLSATLNGIRFAELNDRYEDIISDMTFSTLVVYYDGGKEKIIHDYGHIGPLGLFYLNKQLDAIHERGKR